MSASEPTGAATSSSSAPPQKPQAATAGQPSRRASKEQPRAAATTSVHASKLPLPLLLGGLAGCAGLGLGLTAWMRFRSHRCPNRKGSGKGDGSSASAAGPCAKLKPTSRCVPLADGSACVVRREIAADNSCLFNSIGYAMHKSKTRAPHLRNVVAQQVSGDRTTYSDVFLGMSNEAYCNWIRQPYNWGGGIELSILAQAYGIEIAAWNIESCKEHVFGEESGYKRQVMVIYNGVHYDALAVCNGPRANPDDDETSYNPRTKRGKMIVAAARRLVELAHKESQFHGASKKPTAAPAATTAAVNGPATSSSGSKSKANGTTPSVAAAAASSETGSVSSSASRGGLSNGPITHQAADVSTGGATKTAGGPRRIARGAAAAAAGAASAAATEPTAVEAEDAAAAAASGSAPTAAACTSGAAGDGAGAGAGAAGVVEVGGGCPKLGCGDCGEVLADSAAAAEHAKATGHVNFEELPEAA